MTRSLTSGVQTEIASIRGERIHLYQFEHSGGTIYLTDASTDIDWNGQTWTSFGGLLIHDQVQETSDTDAQSVSVELSNVDQSIIAVILANDFRWQIARIYTAWLLDGDVVADPEEIFRGRQSGAYEFAEVYPEVSGVTGKTANIRTTLTSGLSDLIGYRAVKTNGDSFREFLKRIGLSTTDTFMDRVEGLADKEILWGSESVTGGSLRGRGGGYAGRARE